MNIVDDSGRTIEHVEILATVTGPGTLFYVRLTDGSTHLVGRGSAGFWNYK